MALTDTDKKEIEQIVKKEIKDFFGGNTLKQYEEKLLNLIAKEIKKGKLEDSTKEVVIRVFREFYYTMWTNKNQWESRLKNA
jgi:hypothetical protein